MGGYGVVLRIINGYIVASSPEFGITVTKKFDDIRKMDEIGRLYFDLLEKITNEIKMRTATNQAIPVIRRPQEVIPKNDPPTLTVRDVATMLETSQDSIRRLADQKIIKSSLTHGGHRRFRMSDVENYLSKLTQLNELNEAVL